MTKLKETKYLLILIALSIPSVLALLHKGFYGASDDLHIAWAYQISKIISIGQIPPRFVPDLSYGFGYPLFNFVFPLPFYIASIFHYLSFSFVDSVKVVFGLSLILSAFSMYCLLRKFASPWISIIASLIYLYAPYRSTDVYIRGAIGESLAFVFLPILVLSVVEIFNSSKINLRYVSLLALSLAGLILSHDIVSYMFFPFVIILILILFMFNQNRTKFLKATAIGIILGLLGSVYFWLPALIDSSLMKYSTVFDYFDHFPTLKQLITPYFGYGASVPGPYDGMSFYLGTFNIICLILGSILATLFWRKLQKTEKLLLAWAGLSLFCSIFMMNYRSSLLWDKLPFFPYFQFPWRFLTMTTFLSSLFLVPIKYIKLHSLVWILVSFAVVFFSFNFFRPHDYLERQDDYYLNRYIPVPIPSEEYKGLQEEYLRLPKDAEIRPGKVYPIIWSEKDIHFSVIDGNGLNSLIQIDLENPTTVYYNKYYFPGWRAKIDDREVAIVPANPFGQIAIDVPEGEHLLEFEFTETNFKKLLDLVSLVVLVGLLLLSIKNEKISKK